MLRKLSTSLFTKVCYTFSVNEGINTIMSKNTKNNS